MRTIASLFVLTAALHASAHGPVFGLATPTNSRGEWSFDSGVFGRSAYVGTQLSFRELIAYGVTPHVTLNLTVPAAYSGASLPPTRIQPGDDFEAGGAWRFQHNTTKVGTRLESTAFASLVVPGTQSPFTNIGPINRKPGAMLGAVTGLASRSHYIWLGSTYAKFFERDGSKRPDVLDYSLVYGYRPPKWRTEADKWDWRVFGELVGEHSNDFRSAGVDVRGSHAHQVFVGPSFLGIYRNYTVSFGAQFPVYQDVGRLFPKERVRYAVNFSYLLFKSHTH